MACLAVCVVRSLFFRRFFVLKASRQVPDDRSTLPMDDDMACFRGQVSFTRQGSTVHDL